mgnify:CR=1 FL=1
MYSSLDPVILWKFSAFVNLETYFYHLVYFHFNDFVWEYFSSFSDVLKALNIDQNDLREFISVATSSKEINEDLIYCIFDMICEKMLNWIKPFEQKLVFKPYRISFMNCSTNFLKWYPIFQPNKNMQFRSFTVQST